MQSPPVLVNGIDMDSGTPLLQGLTLEDVCALATGERIGDDCFADLYEQSRRKGRKGTRAPVEGVDANQLSQAGWGIVFAHGENPNVEEALRPLLRLRQEQAGDLFRIFQGSRGVRPGDTKSTFLERQNAPASGLVDPKKMPYYLLLVGSPEQIPFSLQYELDVQYAVGRIHFDNVEDYSRYADAVVEAESGKLPVARRAAFFGPDRDQATRMSRNDMAGPLAEFFLRDKPDWEVQRLFGEDAYKKNLLDCLEQPETPALLFTASHGACYPLRDRRQLPWQGALVMQDWPGEGPASEKHLFGAENVTAKLRTKGMIAFHFACYGAATPHHSDFYGHSTSRFGAEPLRAERPFVAALPKRLLASGALACVGHVDIALSYSFSSSVACYTSLFKKLAEGSRIGFAMDHLNLRHAELSVSIAGRIEASKRQSADIYEIADLWLQNNDARNYIIVGDPAVKVAITGSSEREALTGRIAALESELATLKARLSELSPGAG